MLYSNSKKTCNILVTMPKTTHYAQQYVRELSMLKNMCLPDCCILVRLNCNESGVNKVEWGRFENQQ